MGEAQHLGWLCPTEGHRARMLDMSVRVRRARGIAMGAMLAGTVAVAPTIGWPMMPMLFVAGAAAVTMDKRVARSRHPARVIARTLLLMVALTGFSIALTGGATSQVMPLLAIPVVVSAARFRTVVVWAGAAVAMLVALIAAATSGIDYTIDHPLMLVSTAVLLLAVTAAATALMDAEFEFRTQSVLDPLTGLLNRGGLEARFEEVAEQARLLEQPVCMVLCDLDHFKAVNDSFGHERGDAVLRAVSYEMRKSLRSFELFYRIGGEEFLLLLPGIDLPGGLHLAETLRAAIEDSQPGGVNLTASFGVAAAAGDSIGFLPLYREADASLYASKDAGRNRVSASGIAFSDAVGDLGSRRGAAGLG
ncbi:MAG: diguanylate cyclase [Solirubrobacteraceae bacterium]